MILLKKLDTVDVCEWCNAGMSTFLSWWYDSLAKLDTMDDVCEWCDGMLTLSLIHI